MKKTITLLSLILFLSAISFAQGDQKVSSYGEKITPDKAIESTEISKVLADKDSVHIKISGVVESICQKKGCWLKMDAGNGELMMVRFYDYGFFLPMDCAGKKIILEGNAFKSVTTVDELRHYAEDAGKSKEEINKITDDEKQISFEATGVLLFD
jgi:hypothetical protein